ncbi:hypothetical protein [Parapedobacter koreensis]|uniref:Uncharacterized protein n=1 Tax=Parapedobacter koreensis TaxID=332977 RepID=A0A1H7RTC6_9SPHI|nr:hypothetical protein [Parapedobacter koreensis]SEL63443.1 hypothetical protein SAMN05421740_107293 [Parapedobacter koreensis]
MKTIVLSTLISVAAFGNSFAGTFNDPSNDKNNVTTLKETVAFHQHNMVVLYNQYDLAEARIKASRGNHAELERDHQFFVGLYQQDIADGIRVAQSKKAIEALNARYAKLHAERDTYEALEIAKLQQHLKVALKKEEKAFAKAQKALSQTVIAAR